MSGDVTYRVENANVILRFEEPISTSRLTTDFAPGWEADAKTAGLGDKLKLLLLRLKDPDDGVFSVDISPSFVILETMRGFDFEVTKRHIIATVGATSFTPAAAEKMSVH